MAHHVTRITTLIGSAIVSATALAAPQPFDADLVAALAANPSYPLPKMRKWCCTTSLAARRRSGCAKSCR